MGSVNEHPRLTAPVIPSPTTAYNKEAVSQTNNVFRIFFNQLVGLLRSMMSPDAGARILHYPCSEFYSDTDQTAAATGTPYTITFNQERVGKSFSVESNSQLTAEYEGVYTFHLSTQLTTSNAPQNDAIVWASKNGTNIDYTGRNDNVDDDIILSTNFMIDLTAGDYVEFHFAVEHTDIYLKSVAPTGAFAGIPSATVTISHESDC